MIFNVVIFFWIFGSGVLICIQGKNDDNTRTLHQWTCWMFENKMLTKVGIRTLPIQNLQFCRSLYRDCTDNFWLLLMV